MFENHKHGRESKSGTIIVTGASQGIGAGITKALLQRSYSLVANSRSISRSPFAPTDKLALVDGDIGQASTAEKLAATAVSEFGSIDGVVNNAGIFFFEAVYRVHQPGFSAALRNQPARLRLYHAAGRERNVEAKDRRKYHEHYGDDGRASHRGS